MEEVALINRTYDVILPSGRRNRVNIFDMNLAIACGGDLYVQLEDTSWIKANRLTVLSQYSMQNSRR